MRYPSIDIVRGVAILLMIQVHVVDNLSAWESSSAWLYEASQWLGMLPAPLFTFVSGVSYGLWLRKQEANGRADAYISKISVRRGLFLFGAGIAFNVFVWLPADTFDWDILTLIGTSLLLLAFARHLPTGVLIFLCVVILLFSPIVRELADYSSYWIDDSYEYDFLLEEVLLGFLANGYFPLLPWIVFPILGFVFGDFVFPRPDQAPRNLWRVVALGAGCIGVALMCVLLREEMPATLRKYYATGLSMFPASTEYTIGMLGVCMISLVCLHRWVDQSSWVKSGSPVLEFLSLFSTYSLTVYVVHHMVHLWPLWIYGAWMQGEPTYYWRHAIGTPMAMAMAIGCVIGCYLLLRYLDRRSKLGFEAMMRWVCE